MYFEEVILDLNKQAMDCLNDERTVPQTLKLLQKADKLLEKSGKTSDTYWIQSITLNNFGCYYKKVGKPNSALKFLNQALNLEMKSGQEAIAIAGTRLNM